MSGTEESSVCLVGRGGRGITLSSLLTGGSSGLSQTAKHDESFVTSAAGKRACKHRCCGCRYLIVSQWEERDGNALPIHGVGDCQAERTYIYWKFSIEIKGHLRLLFCSVDKPGERSLR